MDFTGNEKERFRKMLKSGKKEELLMELSKEIEKKEKEMMENISQDYMGIINRCSGLERVKQRLAGILSINSELVSSVSDSVIQYTDVLREIEENSLVESRLSLVVSELKEILSFTGIASEYEDADKEVREDPLYYYDMTSRVLSMEKKLCTLEKYTFFVNANQICIRSRRTLVDLMMKDIDLWISGACNNVRQVGIEVSAMLIEGRKKSHVFDPLDSLHHYLISKGFLCILHESKRLAVDLAVVERVNEKRKEFAERTLSGDEPVLVSDVAGFILWSHYLITLDMRFKMYDRLVFGFLSRNKMLLKSSNFSRIREALVSLRRLTVHLNVDYEDVDRVISSVAINYFESQGPKNADLSSCDMEQLKSSMIAFIDECDSFVSNISQFSNELDELLAKKIDQHLCSLVERNKGDMDLFIKAQSVVGDVLGHAIERNNFYRGLEFRCSAEVDRGNRKFEGEVVEQKKKEIDELFRMVTKNDDFGVDLLKLFSRVRKLRFPESINAEIKRTLVSHIKDRFTGAMSGKDQAPQEKKVVRGHLCSFYGYLRNNEPSLQDLLGSTVEHEKS